MLKITNKLEDKEILVTKGAYENLYKSLGYKIVGEKKEAAIKEVVAPKEPAVEKVIEPKEEIIPEKNDDDELMNSILNKKHSRKKN